MALVRQILAEAVTPPRWPMYLRQMKQFIRAARPDFDERRYGALPDLMRACAKEGFVRLERDRQGGLRLFAPSTQKAPHRPAWDSDEALTDMAEVETLTTATTADSPLVQEAAEAETMHEETPVETVEAEVLPAPVSDEPEDDQLSVFGALRPDDPPPVKAKRGSRARKPSDRPSGEKPKRARKAAGGVASRTRSRRTLS